MKGSYSNWLTKLRVILFCCLAIVAANPRAEGALRSFVPGSLTDIKQAREGKPFILMLWSVDCASCMKELDALSKTINNHPGLDIVMISTDELSRKDSVETMLVQHGLNRIENWIFGDTNTQRLRYEVDSSWFGELPRSYFYDAVHNRLAHSGALSVEHIDAWIAATSP